MIRNKKAVGVKFVRDGQKQTVLARREVILSAGTIGSAHILMLSGIGPREQLKNMKVFFKFHIRFVIHLSNSNEKKN